MNTELVALIYVVAISLLDVCLRAIQRSRDQSWALATIGSVGGAIVFGLIAPLELSLLAPDTVALFVLSGILWSLMVFFDFKALAYVYAVSNEVLGSVRTILLAIVGILMFGELASAFDLLGALFIFLGVACAIPWHHYTRPRGLLLRLASIVTGVAAIVTDKFLVLATNVGMVVLSGYLIPSVIYLLVRPKNWRVQLACSPDTNRSLYVAAILLYIATGPLLVIAFGEGNLTETFFISQSRIVLVFILAYVLLHEREWAWGKAIGTLLCALGVTFIVST